MENDMTLSEFMNKVTAEFINNQWVVKVPVYNGDTITLTSLNATTEYEAKEEAFGYINQEIAAANIAREIEERKYSYSELLSFGNYLLSKRRRDTIKNHPELSEDTFLARYQNVHQADILNWMEENK